MNNLQNNLLTYIGNVLPCDGRLFSYEKCSKALKKLNIKHELTTLRKEFSYAKSDGLLEFRLYYSKKIPVLSAKGKLAIKTQLPFKKYSEWDQKWRLITLDLPQREQECKNLLIAELERLGFAKIQKNTYLSPYPLLNIINRFSTDLGVRQHLVLAQVDELKDLDNLIKNWNVEEINLKYKNFIKSAKNSSKTSYWPLLAKQLEQEFVDLYAQDPHLPTEILPKDWLGFEAYKVFKQISNSY